MSALSNPAAPVQSGKETQPRPSGQVERGFVAPAQPREMLENEFRSLIDNSPDGICRLDRALRHIYVNPAFAAAAGRQVTDCIGKNRAELGFPTDTAGGLWDAAAQAVFDSGSEQRFEFHAGSSSAGRHYTVKLVPEIDPVGKVASLLGILYDASEYTRMQKEHELLLGRERNARIQAETAARARDEFLAIVSHELRAPLNGIQSWSHILENYVKESASSPLAQRALQGIKTGVAQQVRLIEDLLDVTRMMSGKLRLVKQPFTLLPVIQAAVESVRDVAAAKHIDLSCTYSVTDERIDGDSDRVQQVIWNLLSNAIKFTPDDGHIRLTAAPGEASVVITVSDTGIGITPEFLPHLFDRFSQGDTSSTRGHSGLGLGLFLVRHLIELHGGTVKAESPGAGKGTTFSVTIPLRVKRDHYVPATQSDGISDSVVSLPSLAGLRILLVDDQEEARESLTAVLSSAGASVFSAAAAGVVLDWLPTVGGDRLPDILVCDIAMPVEDGYAVLRRIRSWRSADGTYSLQKLPALALTAFAHREDRIRALTAGFQMHVTKPVAPEELIVVIATLMGRGQ